MNWWREWGWPALSLAVFCVCMTYIVMVLASVGDR